MSQLQFEDYVRAFIGSESVALPEHSMRIGSSDAGWFETQPGYAHVYATGGSVDDRRYAYAIMKAALAGHEIAPQPFSLQWDHSDERLIKEADWNDIEAKAKRLIQSGAVQILRNAPDVIVGQVQGDHGNYQTECHRDDPSSQALTLWSCECEWDQFAWQRTRQWKKYEGRVCSHVLATWWLAQSMPLDEESEPGGEGGGPEYPGAGGMVPPGAAPQITPGMSPPLQQGLANPPGTETPPPGQAPELMPQYPANPEMLPAINPVSVPGQKPQTPLNPVQNAGGTFSHVAANKFVNGQMVQLKNQSMGEQVGLGGGGQTAIPANSLGEVLGTEGSGEYEMIFVYFSGPQAEAGKLEAHGVQAWFFSNELIPRPDVRAPGPTIRRRR